MNAVVTLTRGKWPEWTVECARSVVERLPQGWAHCFVDGNGDYQQIRWESMRLGEFVAIVDDDDRLVGDSLNWCVEAIAKTGAGIAFTYEGQIDETGAALPARNRRITLFDAASHPRMLHHLTVIRTDCLDPVCFELAQHFGVGIDWIMKAWCALKHGAVQVEAVGYEWRRHDLGLSHTEADKYEAAMPHIRKHLRSWIGSDAHLHRFVPG